MLNAPSVVQNVWSTAARLGYGKHFISVQSDPITDDHTYINKLALMPMIDIIEYEMSDGNYFGSYWHTHDDNMNTIDPEVLGAVGQVVTAFLYNSSKKPI